MPMIGRGVEKIRIGRNYSTPDRCPNFCLTFTGGKLILNPARRAGAKSPRG
jgi:hypothetical protein